MFFTANSKADNMLSLVDYLQESGIAVDQIKHLLSPLSLQYGTTNFKQTTLNNKRHQS